MRNFAQMYNRLKETINVIYNVVILVRFKYYALGSPKKLNHMVEAHAI